MPVLSTGCAALSAYKTTSCLLTIVAFLSSSYDIIHSFEPFGLENEKPIFLIEKTKIKQITLFGRNLEFSKLVVTQDWIEKEITFFDEVADLQEGDEIDVVATISKSTFGAENKIQILAKELIKIKK